MELNNVYKEAKEYIADALKVLNRLSKSYIVTEQEKKNIEFWENSIESIDRASGIIKNKEQEAHLADSAIKFANQITFLVFRRAMYIDKIEDAEVKELMERFSKFPTPEQTQMEVDTFTASRQERIDAINKQQAEVNAEVKDLELFRAVIGGMAVEEAKQKQEAYYEQIKAAQKQAKI